MSIKEDMRHWLENQFPWLTDDLAEVVVKKLSADDIGRLRGELDAAKRIAMIGECCGCTIAPKMLKIP